MTILPEIYFILSRLVSPSLASPLVLPVFSSGRPQGDSQQPPDDQRPATRWPGGPGDPSQQRPRLREPAPRRLRVRAANEASALHPRPQVRPRPGGDEAREVDEAPSAAGRRPVEEEADPAPADSGAKKQRGPINLT